MIVKPPLTLNFQHRSTKYMSDKINDASSNGREQFNKTSNPQPEKQGLDSEQVKNSQPALRGPKPPISVGPAQDRLTHQQKMQKDDKDVELYNAAKARNERENQLGLDKDKEK